MCMSSQCESGIVSKSRFDVKKECRFALGIRPSDTRTPQTPTHQPLNAHPTLNKSDTCITENTMMAIPAARIGANITNPITGATNRANNGAENEHTKISTKQLGIPIRTIIACRAKSSRLTFSEAFRRKSSKQIKCPNPLTKPSIANINWPLEGPCRKGAGRNRLFAP